MFRSIISFESLLHASKSFLTPASCPKERRTDTTESHICNYFFCYVHGSVHRESMSIIVQRDATIYSFIIFLQRAPHVSDDTLIHHQEHTRSVITSGTGRCFDEECSGILDQRKQAKMQWIQDPSQSNVDNLNIIRRDASRHLRNKRRHI